MEPLKKGFTLLETVAAILIISISFGFLVFLLTQTVKNLAYTSTRWENFKKLDYAYKDGNFANLSTRAVRFKGYTLRVFTYGNETIYELAK